MPRKGRERLPFEDSDAGLYLHEPDQKDLLAQRSGLDGSTRYYLPVEQFMEMQRERDEYRKALSVANAVLLEYPQRRAEEVLKSVASVIRTKATGLTEANAKAMASILAQFRSAPSTQEASG